MIELDICIENKHGVKRWQRVKKTAEAYDSLLSQLGKTNEKGYTLIELNPVELW